MFELWARRRPVEGKGFPYQWITNFDREEQKYFMTDQLDKEVWQECMVVQGQDLILYLEFDKPIKEKTKGKRR